MFSSQPVQSIMTQLTTHVPIYLFIFLYCLYNIYFQNMFFIFYLCIFSIVKLIVCFPCFALNGVAHNFVVLLALWH